MINSGVAAKFVLVWSWCIRLGEGASLVVWIVGAR